ncbi:beta-1,2-xylosyltransferase-like [Rutidosis leptorrhynchoides]|uniref:beta-1,2-xylosyltransferase-like n=1 Tax=Rutidosis leptorrhynchoides TaxID=125765 RepID=UPI003A99ECE0
MTGRMKRKLVGFKLQIQIILLKLFALFGSVGPSLYRCWNPNDKKTTRISEFVEMIRLQFFFVYTIPGKQVGSVWLTRLNGYELKWVMDQTDQVYSTRTPPQFKSGSRNHNVLFVRRENYLAHHGGTFQSRLSNEQQVFDALKTWSSSQNESKLIWTFGIWTYVCERTSERNSRCISYCGCSWCKTHSRQHKLKHLRLLLVSLGKPHFELIYKWKGLRYPPLYLGGSQLVPLLLSTSSWTCLRLGC